MACAEGEDGSGYNCSQYKTENSTERSRVKQHKGKGKGTGKGIYGQHQTSWTRVSNVPETKGRKGVADGKLRCVEDGTDGMGAGRRGQQ